MIKSPVEKKLDELKASNSVMVMPSVQEDGERIVSVTFPMFDDKYKNVFERDKISLMENIVAEFRYPAQKDNIVKEHLELYQEEPFFASLMHEIIRTEEGPVVGHKARRVPVRDENGEYVLDEDGLPTFEIQDVVAKTVPTACVWYDTKLSRYKAFYNKIFMSHLTSLEKKAVIKHEMYHIIFKHLNMRLMPDEGKKDDETISVLKNVATDLAINSFLADLPKNIIISGWILEEMNEIKKSVSDEELQLILNSQEVIWIKEKPNNTQELIFYLALSNIGIMNGCVPGEGEFKGMPPYKTSEWYFNALMQKKEEEGKSSPKRGSLCGSGTGTGMIDVHIIQGEIDNGETNDPQAEKTEHKRILKKGEARSNSSSWGSMTSDIKDEINKYLSNEVDWRKQLEFFVRKSQSVSTYNTFHKTNKRYRNPEDGAPWAPGPKTEVQSKIYVFIDESGSVSNVALEEFFAVLRDLSKYASFVLIPFDTEVKLEEKVVWKRGEIMKDVPRVACGGTCFQCVTDYCNKNSSEIEAAIIMTDFLAPQPTVSKVQRLWIGAEKDVKSTNFKFASNERVVSIKTKEN